MEAYLKWRGQWYLFYLHAYPDKEVYSITWHQQPDSKEKRFKRGVYSQL